jgi:hypothetical protein
VPKFASKARELLKHKASQFNGNDDVMAAFADFAPDLSLIVPSTGEHEAKLPADELVAENASPNDARWPGRPWGGRPWGGRPWGWGGRPWGWGGRPYGPKWWDHEGDGQEELLETSSSHPDHASGGKEALSKTSSTDPEQSEPSFLNFAMNDMSSQMHEVSSVLGRDLTRDMLSKIFNKVLDSALGPKLEKHEASHSKPNTPEMMEKVGNSMDATDLADKILSSMFKTAPNAHEPLSDDELDAENAGWPWWAYGPRPYGPRPWGPYGPRPWRPYGPPPWMWDHEGDGKGEHNAGSSSDSPKQTVAKMDSSASRSTMVSTASNEEHKGKVSHEEPKAEREADTASPKNDAKWPYGPYGGPYGPYGGGPYGGPYGPYGPRPWRPYGPSPWWWDHESHGQEALSKVSSEEKLPSTQKLPKIVQEVLSEVSEGKAKRSRSSHPRPKANVMHTGPIKTSVKSVQVVPVPVRVPVPMLVPVITNIDSLPDKRAEHGSKHMPTKRSV